MANVTACIKPMVDTSNGVFQGDNPVRFALPLIIVQIIFVIVVTRLLGLLVKPLHQPRVIAEIVGGLLLGPSALGRNKLYMANIFPPQSMTTLEVFADMGLLFFLFMVGLELDLKQISKTGRQALLIAAAGISLPFTAGVGVSFVLKQTIAQDGKFGPFLVFMGVAMSITAFPVLARILAERKLLTTDVGQIAMAAAAVNDVVAWVLLALAVALSGSGKSPTIVVWVLLCGIGFVIVMFVAVRPVMTWIANRCTTNEPVKEFYICVTLAGVLVAGFCTDAIGIHSIFGAFLLGLVIPKQGPFAEILVEKLEDFITILFLPLYFAVSGLKTNIGTIHGGRSVGLLVLVISVACLGKILGTFLAAKLSHLNFNRSITLGVLMNTKGLVELIVLNIGLARGVLNEQTFAIMVLMALFTTFITTPLVMAIYKPARNPIPYTRRKLDMQDDPKNDFRILSCVHGMKNVPAMINLMETTRGIRKRALRLYILHLMELSERTSAIMMVQRARRDGRPFVNEGNPDSRDQVVVAFDAYGQLSKVTVRPMTAISGFEDMHEDICTAAADKRIAIIILPFHKNQRLDGSFETTTPGFRNVNYKVLQHAPCSVAILVDRGLGGHSQLASSSVDHNVVVLFFGGADDREALAYGCRMVEHPGVKLHVIRFILSSTIDSHETSSSDTAATATHDHVGINVHPVSLGEHFSDITNGLANTSRHFNEFMALGLQEQEQQQQLDNEAIDLVQGYEAKSVENKENGFNVKKVTYEEISVVGDPFEAMVASLTNKTSTYHLILVGRSRRPTPLVAQLFHRHAHCSELGPIGHALLDPRIRASVLVFQQHDPMLQAISTLPDSSAEQGALAAAIPKQ